MGTKERGLINLERLHEYPIVCPDTETTGLSWQKDKAFGIALAVYDGEKIHSDYFDLREKPGILKVLNRELPKAKRIVNHNMKFDAHILREAGVRVPLDRIECTSVRAALINEWEPFFSLDALGIKHLGRGKETGVYEELAQLFGGKPTKDVQMENLHRAPERLARKYAIADPELAILLWLWQEKEIERQELRRVVDLERDVLETLVEVEQHGVAVDEQRAHDSQKDIQVNIDTALAALQGINGGKPFNPNSAPQMRALFKVEKRTTDKLTEWFTDTGFKLTMTDGGEASLAKESLEVMARLGDLRAKHVMASRRMIKARSFLKDHILGHAINGRVHPNYNQTRSENGLGTGTGRFSIDDPALQQIPARDVDIAAIVRSCFVPNKGDRWACGDWEQFEFRWFAHYTKDPTILSAYAADPRTDYHAIVSKITGIQRNARHAGDANAKQINLGLVFGMGQGEMAYQMGLDYTSRYEFNEDGTIKREWKNAGPKAKGIFQTYHAAIPGVQQLLNQAASIARARGYVTTAMGRHLRFPGGKATHKAAGLVFQGTSGDCMKVKMVILHRMGKKMGFNYLLSVHDEHDLSIPEGSVKKLIPVIKKELETFDGNPISCRIPILSSIKTGPTWWDACKKD